ncbi:MAG: ATP-dependent helicase [Acidobacteriia bacterium]|nr:ATP-dependent helicase [Terriglobia bacterium]
MPWNTGLQGTPLNIAAYAGAQLRVVAGPGTGKTFALMRRVARLLEQNVQPNHILAVTYTRTAALDLVGKLAQLGVAGADQVAAKTLHSLSFGLLSRTAVFQTLGRNARPLLAYEQDTMACDLGPQFGGKRKVNKLVKAFDAYWARLQHHQPGWPNNPVEQAFDHALKAWLRFHRAMLVGELIPLALDFVSQNPGHPDIPQYEHVLVDEYQDLNRADQALIDAIAGNAAVTVIGDEDQSIYGFRHAHPEGIAQYPQTHAGTHDELLNECRRCPQRVVNMANELISHNQRLAPKTLNPRPQNAQGDVYIVQHHSLEDEVSTIADYIDWYLQQHQGMAAGEVLVLSSRRLIGNGIRDRLNEIAQQNGRTWQAQSFYFEDALTTDIAADGFALLTQLVDPEDRPSLRYWLGEHAQDCKRLPYARLRAHCEQSGQSPRAALQDMGSGALTIPHTATLVTRFNALTLKLTALMALDLAALIDTLFPDGNADVISVRQGALLSLPNVANAKELLDELRSTITQPELPGSQGPSVRIMSLYKSKGLTARLVVIAGCIAGIMPSIDPKDAPAEQERQRQEQRRLFYVGITRTTETLMINSSIRMLSAAAFRMRMPKLATAGMYVILQASPMLPDLGPTAPPSTPAAAWRALLGF